MVVKGEWPELHRWGRARRMESGVGIARDLGSGAVSGAGSTVGSARWHGEDEWVFVRRGAARCVPALR